MRLLYSLFIAFTLVAITNAEAKSNGDLYKDCKKYADRSFEPEKISDIVCLAYFRGVYDFSVSICNAWGTIMDKEESSEARHIMKTFRKAEGAGEDLDLDAAIQVYVNKMGKNPDTWKYRADYQVLSSLQQLAPCE